MATPFAPDTPVIYELSDFNGVVRSVKVYFDEHDNEFVATVMALPWNHSIQYGHAAYVQPNTVIGEGRSQESPLDATECALENWRCREKDRIAEEE